MANTTNTKAHNSDMPAHAHHEHAHAEQKKDKGNSNLIYIVAALAIIVVAGIVIFHYYTLPRSVPPSISTVSNSSITSSQSSPSTSNLNSTLPPISNYTSPYPLVISGMQRFEAVQIPVSELPSNISAGLSTATLNVYRNATSNSTLSITGLNYSSSSYVSPIFNELKSSASLSAARNSSIKLLGSLPPNYVGITSSYNTANVYSILGYNSTKVCIDTYISTGALNQTVAVNLLENASNTCFKN